MDALFPIQWVPRDPSLEPRAVAAVGEVAARLVRRLLEGPDEALAGLSGVAAPGLVVLMGSADRLPWVDGARYFGQDPAAPSLLLPTTHRPALPAQLVERAFRQRFASLGTPLLIYPGLSRVAPVGGALPVDRAALEAWLKEENGHK